MIVDESGQNRRAAELDRFRVRWNARSQLRSRPDRYDSVALHENENITLYDIGLSIDHAPGVYRVRSDNRRHRGNLCPGGSRECKQQKERWMGHVPWI
jgi:hypothetical protein